MRSTKPFLSLVLTGGSPQHLRLQYYLWVGDPRFSILFLIPSALRVVRRQLDDYRYDDPRASTQPHRMVPHGPPHQAAHEVIHFDLLSIIH